MTSIFQRCTVAALIVLLYVPSFWWMWERWFARDSYYSHGILIPFISAFLIWRKREILGKITPQGTRLGLGIFFFGIALEIISALFRVYFTASFSLIIILFGLVLYFYGKQMARELFFPILFLAFMVPLPLVVVTNLSFRLKILATKIAVGALNGMGLPCVQHGSAILLRHAYIIVEDVCSGLRSLITLMALGSLFAYATKTTALKKAVILASTIPIAVVTNVLRIIFLASVSEIWGTAYAMGPLHETSGFIVFAGAFCLLYVVKKLIE